LETFNTSSTQVKWFDLQPTPGERGVNREDIKRRRINIGPEVLRKWFEDLPNRLRDIQKRKRSLRRAAIKKEYTLWHGELWLGEQPEGETLIAASSITICRAKKWDESWGPSLEGPRHGSMRVD